MKTFTLSIVAGKVVATEKRPDYLSIIGVGAVVVSMLTVIFSL
jgi:hypothetical protein